MSVLVVVSGFIGAIVLVIVRALAVDEVRGRVQRRITSSVEATISSLPQELQDEWADEWRGDLSVLISMPWTAATYARGLRQSAKGLLADRALAPAVASSLRAPMASRVRTRSPVRRMRMRMRTLSVLLAEEVVQTFVHALSEVVRGFADAVVRMESRLVLLSVMASVVGVMVGLVSAGAPSPIAGVGTGIVALTAFFLARR